MFRRFQNTRQQSQRSDPHSHRRQSWRQSSRRCAGCRQGRDRGQLIKACMCPNRFFHYPCLATHLTQTRDRVCPYCQRHYRDRRIFRETDSPGLFGIFSRIFSAPLLILIIIAFIFLRSILFERFKRDGKQFPIYAIFGAFLFNTLFESFVSIYRRRSHQLIRFTEMPGPQSSVVIVDITEEAERQLQRREAIEGRNWARAINQREANRPSFLQIRNTGQTTGATGAQPQDRQALIPFIEFDLE